MLESHSNHIEFYERRASRKTDFFFGLFMILPEMLILIIITEPYPNDSHSNNTLELLHEHFYILPIICCIFNLLIILAFTQRRISTAKKALRGALIDIEPRWEEGILTKVHPNDSEIGKPIHMNFDNNLKSGDILYLNGVRVTEVKEEEYTWTETVQSHSMYDDGERYGYGSGGGGASQVIYGTSIRIKTTLIHEEIKYSGGNFNAKEGDVLDIIVRISGINESVVSIRNMRTLSLTSNNHEEE